MPRHPPIALKTLDRSHCQCPPAQSRSDCRFSLSLTGSASAQFRRNCRMEQILCRIRSDVIGTKRPASRDRFEGAVRQAHHMREIERLPRQITNLSAHEVRTNLLFTMSNRTSGKPRKLTTNLFTNDFFSPSLLDTSARSTGPSRTATIPSGLRRGQTATRWLKRQSYGLRKWWSRTGSNRRHPACKAGALPAELRPLISFCRGDRQSLRIASDNPSGCTGDGGPGRT